MKHLTLAITLLFGIALGYGLSNEQKEEWVYVPLKEGHYVDYNKDTLELTTYVGPENEIILRRIKS